MNIKKKMYPGWYAAPAMVVYTVIFLLPLVGSLFFCLTVWDFKGFRFVGLENFIMFFSESRLSTSVKNTLIYAFSTCLAKVVLGFMIAVFLNMKIKSKNLLRAIVFFPHLVSTVAIGIVFKALMHPTKGLLNQVLGAIGLPSVQWLSDPGIALYSIIGASIWKGLGVATIIYLAGLQAVDKTYYEAAEIDGAGFWHKLRYITMPLVRPAMNSVIILELISGMRWFDMIWTMTEGGPGFATDVLASVVYKQYAAGFYGLSTTGNVIMFVLVGVIVFPLQKFLLSKEVY